MKYPFRVSPHSSAKSTSLKRCKLAALPKKYVLVALLFLVVIGLAIFGLSHQVSAPESKEYIKARLGTQTFVFRVADTPDAREQGLSHQPRLSDQEGMLFIFPAAEVTCFWMKDMSFNLDILWFDADKRLVDQQRDLSPDTYPQSFCPSTPAQYVIEVSAGSAGKLNLKIGDQFRFLEKQ